MLFSEFSLCYLWYNKTQNTMKTFEQSFLIWLLVTVVMAILGYTGIAMCWAIAGLLPVYVVCEVIDYYKTR